MSQRMAGFEAIIGQGRSCNFVAAADTYYRTFTHRDQQRTATKFFRSDGTRVGTNLLELIRCTYPLWHSQNPTNKITTETSSTLTPQAKPFGYGHGPRCTQAAYIKWHVVEEINPPDLDETGDGTLVDEHTHEAVVPPRRRQNRSSTRAIQEDVNIEVQQKRPERATKKRAKEEKIWMDPQAGVPKGKGAANAHKALKRERALSDAEHALKAKRAKAAFDGGKGIPPPSKSDGNESDDDIVMTYVAEHRASARPSKPTSRKAVVKALKQQVAPHCDRMAKNLSSRSKHVGTVDSDSSALELDEIESNMDSERSDLDIESSGDSNNEALSPAQFSFEQASIIKPRSTTTSGKSKKPALLSSDSDDAEDDDLESWSPPPMASAPKKLGGKGGQRIREYDTVLSSRRDNSKPRQKNMVITKSSASLPAAQSRNLKVPQTPQRVLTEREPPSTSTKPSKRMEAHRKEQPTIKGTAEDTESDEELKTWSSAATAIATSKGNYNLTSQPETLQRIIECTTFLLLDFAAFKTVYPQYSKPGPFSQNFFLRACDIISKQEGASKRTRREAKEIWERFEKDGRFLQSLSSLATTRFIQFRSRSKTNANIVDGTLDLAAPYKHPAIKNHLRMWLMEEKGNGKIAVKFERRFKKLAIDEYGKPCSGGELSIPLVAASAAAVHGVLKEKDDGVVVSPQFTEETFHPYYTHHVETLTELSIRHPNKFHEIMAELYAYVRGWILTKGKDKVPKAKPIYNFDVEERDVPEGQSESVAASLEDGKEVAEAEGVVEAEEIAEAEVDEAQEGSDAEEAQ
ncbi:hypothetical protein PQX77_006111 [Marasmius sp. AFHP31]|nr:hypothetical protein PQX77_006111 [Marasmius sp. AFHP31]